MATLNTHASHSLQTPLVAPFAVRTGGLEPYQMRTQLYFRGFSASLLQVWAASQ